MSNSINNNGTNSASLNQLANTDSQNQNSTFGSLPTTSVDNANTNIPASTQASVNDQEVGNRLVTTTKEQITTTSMPKDNSAEANLDATNNNCNTVKDTKEQINSHLEKAKKKQSCNMSFSPEEMSMLGVLAGILMCCAIFIPLSIYLSLFFLLPLLVLSLICLGII